MCFKDDENMGKAKGYQFETGFGTNLALITDEKKKYIEGIEAN